MVVELPQRKEQMVKQDDGDREIIPAPKLLREPASRSSE